MLSASTRQKVRKRMREQYHGKEGRLLKNGDKVEITFYSYIEPLSSVIGTVQGDYLDVEEGSIPLEKSKIYCTEIRIINEDKDA
jgi:hypothetical protein